MSTVSGRVIRAESRSGIEGLMVTLYAADVEDARVGSVLTGATGAFTLSYDPATFMEASQRSLDLKIVVTAIDSEASLATATRRNASGAEVFILRIAQDVLTAAGVEPARTRASTEDIVAALVASRQRTRQLDDAARRSFTEDIRAERDLRERTVRQMQPFFAALSGAAPRQREPGGRFVAQGGSVHEANRRQMTAAIDRRINNATLTGRIGLSDTQIASLRNESGKLAQQISPEVIETLLKPAQTLLHGLARLDLFRLCRDEPPDECIARLAEPAPETSSEEPVPTPEAEAVPPPLGEADIPQLLRTLTADLKSPESIHSLGVPTRPDIDDVEQSVKAFSLHSGPADVPAFHDFHQVRIAFESVWSELFDDDVVGKGEELYEMLVEVGEDPNAYLFFNDEFVLKPKKKKKKKGKAGGKADNPPEVVPATFEVSPDQWRALPGAYQEALQELAEGIRRVRLMPMAEKLEVLPGIQFTIPVNETELRSREKTVTFLREQGNRILRYANHLGDDAGPSRSLSRNSP